MVEIHCFSYFNKLELVLNITWTKKIDRIDESEKIYSHIYTFISRYGANKP